MTAGLGALSDFRKLSARRKLVILFLTAMTAFLGILYPTILSVDPRVSPMLSLSYEPGELADADVISPVTHSFIDEAATDELVAAAAEGILPQFAYSVSQSIRWDSSSTSPSSACRTSSPGACSAPRTS